MSSLFNTTSQFLYSSVIERGVTITGVAGRTGQARDNIRGRAIWERDDRKFSPGRSS